MKKITSGVMAAAFLLALNIQHPPVADKAITTAPQTAAPLKGDTYAVNTETSSIGWIGTKPSGKHNGIIKISKGSLAVEKNTISGGNLTIDMNTITCNDLQGKGKDGLEGHLKSGDFFDVANNPTGLFEITSVVPVAEGQKIVLPNATHTVSGNLTLRGATKNISFPAVIAMEAGAITATADFNIDRTLWNINYGADGKIAKEINLKLDIKAAK